MISTRDSHSTKERTCNSLDKDLGRKRDFTVDDVKGGLGNTVPYSYRGFTRNSSLSLSEVHW